MRRREFIKRAAAAIGSVLPNPCLPGLHADKIRGVMRAAPISGEIPDLDELSGDWMSGSIIEQTPALANFHGSLEASRNVLGIQNFTVPPFAQGGEMAILEVNGAAVSANDFRWYPYQVQRRATVDNVRILTTLRMPFEQSGLLLSADITNTGSKSYTATLAINIHNAIRRYPGKWEWETPRPRDEEQRDFQPGVSHLEGGDLLYVRDAKSQSASGFMFWVTPDQISNPSLGAAWTLRLEPGETVSLKGVMAVGPEIESTGRQAAEWKAKFSAVWEEGRIRWEERYLAAFDPENRHFSGNLPTLVTSDGAIRRLYYNSIVSLLCLERTNLNAEYPRVFVTASPRWATTLVYFWDTSFFATLWALLDPVCMKQQLTLFLASNIHSCYAIDFQSMETVGPWYSANDYSIFQLVTTYLKVTGDAPFLNKQVKGDKRVIDYLEEISLHWQTLTKGSGLLADYGGASNLLETVPTYINCVPSMNAANVWMMRSMTKIRSDRGEPRRAKELNQLADKLAGEVLGLYVDGQGFWSCRMANGKKIDVRHCIDFFTTIAAMKDDLGARRIEEMVAFVDRELWTPEWLYALSPLDGAARDSTRPDHGSTGAYDAWPALTAETIFRVGRKSEALERLRSVAPATREGPFGQAHYVATNGYPVRKALDLQDYFESASGSFAEVIVRTLFGFPDKVGEEVQASRMVPGFEGSLKNVRFRERLLTTTIPRAH